MNKWMAFECFVARFLSLFFRLFIDRFKRKGHFQRGTNNKKAVYDDGLLLQFRIVCFFLLFCFTVRLFWWNRSIWPEKAESQKNMAFILKVSEGKQRCRWSSVRFIRQMFLRWSWHERQICGDQSIHLIIIIIIELMFF